MGSFIAFVAPTTGFASTFAAHYHGDVLDSNSAPIATAYMSLISLPLRRTNADTGIIITI
jgi:hypothetical protein